MSYKFLIISALCLFCFSQTQAQTTTQVNQDPKTGIRITTRITPLKPLAQQITELEAQMELARQNPARVADGTIQKYEQAIAAKRRQLEEEQRNTPAAPPVQNN